MKHRTSIQERLRDGVILWQSGRKEGAFIIGLIALAGLSRIRYPKGTKAKVYFEKMREYHPNQKDQIDDRERKGKKQDLNDGEAFKCALLDLIGDIVLPNPPPGMHQPRINFTIPFGTNSAPTNIEDIFYHAFRCTFVHEAQMTPDVFLTAPTPQGDLVRLTHPTGIPENWIRNLFFALGNTPELCSA